MVPQNIQCYAYMYIKNTTFSLKGVDILAGEET